MPDTACHQHATLTPVYLRCRIGLGHPEGRHFCCDNPVTPPVKVNKVAYCIVHKVDRLAGNRADDVSIHLALQRCGVMLVSASENIDETPSGMLLHGIMSTIAEFYSRNLANEVAKGINQKAIGGGANGKAPIGYLNVRKRDELGREMRVVEPDPDRAALVKWAFEAYATGNYSTITLHEELIDRGLARVPTPKRPSKAPALSTIQKMLTNPYYKGQVSFRTGFTVGRRGRRCDKRDGSAVSVRAGGDERLKP